MPAVAIPGNLGGRRASGLFGAELVGKINDLHGGGVKSDRRFKA